MISEQELNNLTSWFDTYTRGFQCNPDLEYNRNVELKIAHTKRVCNEMNGLAKSLDLSKTDSNLAYAIALFHDIGRFEQYDKHRTFADHKSENHAALGIKILKDNHVLDRINNDARDIIFHSVSLHNCAELPKNDNTQLDLYAKLARDSDKLDIWQLVIDHYKKEKETQNIALELGLPRADDVSDFVLNDIESGEIVKIKHLRTLNDFKLLQISWIYDINFAWTFKCIKERKYLEGLLETIPKNKRILEIYRKACSYIDKIVLNL